MSFANCFIGSDWILKAFPIFLRISTADTSCSWGRAWVVLTWCFHFVFFFVAQLRHPLSSIGPATQGQPVASGEEQAVVTGLSHHQEGLASHPLPVAHQECTHWNGQPPIDRQACPQKEFTQQCQATRHDSPAAAAAGCHTKESLIEKAISTSYRFSFPTEATSFDEQTEYYRWLDDILRQIQPQIRPTTNSTGRRNFVSRIAFDGVRLKKLMVLMLSDKWPAILSKLSKNHKWEEWTQRLRSCCARKPDLDYAGWAKLRSEVFETRFKGDNGRFLNDMFEKHHGETIEIHRKSSGEVDDPWSPYMHHPQLFVDAHRNEAQKAAMREAVGVFYDSSSDRRLRNSFLYKMQTVPTSAFTPLSKGMCFKCLVRMEAACKHGLCSF